MVEKRGWARGGMLLALAALLLATRGAARAQAPVFPATVSQSQVAGLLDATAWVRGLDEAALARLVPEQSGLHFVGCANCASGKQEQQLDWDPSHPDEVVCRFCQHRYPSAKYPMDQVLVAQGPRGKAHKYPYWADAKGYRYFFAARRDELVRAYLTQRAYDLARLYAATGDRAYARRSGLILARFAEVFPDWCYHYDYPFQQKEIYDGAVPPEKLRPGYRTARWTWWAYADLPGNLVQAYDLVRGSGVFADLSKERGGDVPARIERDLFRNMADEVLANPEGFSNMSPGMWRSLVVLGRVIGEPRYVHEPVRRLRRFVETRFAYDGTWPEGSPDYTRQTLGGLDQVIGVATGYSDPVGYQDPVDGGRFDNLSLDAEVPTLRAARAALEKLRLPDGRWLPIHDSWATSRTPRLKETEPFLLPALGHACLGGGSGERQAQLHLTWSGGYGHQHGDDLSLLLFAHGQELLSDVGYSHTRYRSWTMATAAHNTVLIDGESQWFGDKPQPSDGSLRWFDARDPQVQTVSADGERGYPGRAERYRRTLVLVDAGEGRRYAVDRFEVRGGKVHDYFLHGNADLPGTAAADLKLEPLPTLLPEGTAWQPTRNEGEASRIKEPHYAYGFLRDLRSGPIMGTAAVPVTFRTTDTGPALRATLLPEPGSRLVLGQNPAVRGAGEDDAKLDQFLRPFLMLRHAAGEAGSAFASVLEPNEGASFLQSVERLDVPGAGLAVRVRSGERTDLVVLEAPRPVSLPVGDRKASFAGDVGVLSLRGTEVEHAYVLGDSGWTFGDFRLVGSAELERPLAAIERDALVLEGGAPLPDKGDLLRLKTADGWVYPFTVTGAEADGGRVRVRVAEGPGMTWEAAERRLKLRAFPQREHAGAVRVAWRRSTSGPRGAEAGR